MPRPNNVTENDLKRWDDIIDNDPNLPGHLAQMPIIREVCYAGQYLVDELTKLQCPDVLIARIMYTGGKLSFGRDAWEVHQELIDKYKNNTLEYDADSTEFN